MAMHMAGIVGEYGIAAEGPTIILVITSPAAALWMKQLLLGMVGSEGIVDLAAQPGVSLKGLGKLELVRLEGDQLGRLARTRRTADFVWSGNDQEWRRKAELLGRFICGQKGHVQLSSFHQDDAVMEISFGETFSAADRPDPHLPAIRARGQSRAALTP